MTSRSDLEAAVGRAALAWKRDPNGGYGWGDNPPEPFMAALDALDAFDLRPTSPDLADPPPAGSGEVAPLGPWDAVAAYARAVSERFGGDVEVHDVRRIYGGDLAVVFGADESDRFVVVRVLADPAPFWDELAPGLTECAPRGWRVERVGAERVLGGFGAEVILAGGST